MKKLAKLALALALALQLISGAGVVARSRSLFFCSEGGRVAHPTLSFCNEWRLELEISYVNGLGAATAYGGEFTISATGCLIAFPDIGNTTALHKFELNRG